MTLILANSTVSKLPPIQRTEFYAIGKEIRDSSYNFSKSNRGFAVY